MRSGNTRRGVTSLGSDPCQTLFSFTFGELGEPGERNHARVTQPTKGAGTLRRAVRSQAFARILGGTTLF